MSTSLRLVADPPKLVDDITPVELFKVQFACEAFVKTFVDSEYTIVSPVAETVANVPFEISPANVPSDPAVSLTMLVHLKLVNTAEEDLTANPSVFSILI